MKCARAGISGQIKIFIWIYVNWALLTSRVAGCLLRYFVWWRQRNSTEYFVSAESSYSLFELAFELEPIHQFWLSISNLETLWNPEFSSDMDKFCAIIVFCSETDCQNLNHLFAMAIVACARIVLILRVVRGLEAKWLSKEMKWIKHLCLWCTIYCRMKFEPFIEALLKPPAQHVVDILKRCFLPMVTQMF